MDPDIDDEEALAERVARVVEIRDGTVWLEPEPTAACGGCLSLAACGLKGGSRKALAARRFPLPDDGDFRVGERVVVGLPDSAVLRASATAYGVPLLTMVVAAMVAEGMGADNGTGAMAILGGLAGGLVLARGIAGWLAERGDLAPRYLRRVAAGGDCGRDPAAG